MITSFRRLAALAAGGLLSAVAVAQIDAAQDRGEGTAAEPVASAAADPAAERAEDVEVLRRILNQSLGLPNKVAAPQQTFVPLQQGGFGGTMMQPGGFGGFQGGGIGGLGAINQPVLGTTTVVTQPNIGPFDGVYLAGHGVAYTLHVPEQLGFWLRPPDRSVGLAEFCAKCHATEPTSRSELEPAAPAGKPTSEWERMRDELQGKKPETKPQQPAAVSSVNVCEPGKTANRLVSKLAQNARHVRHLPAGERVTVVVTYDGVRVSAKDRQVPNAPVSGEVYGTRPLTLVDDKGAPVPRGFTAEETKQFALGDLHLKQNKPKEAAQAYERALARFKEPLTKMNALAGLDDAQNRAIVTELVPKVQDAYAKLAQAWLAAGEKDKAAAALEMSRKFSIELAPGSAPAKEKAVPVPAKLMVSVTKADLDKAGDDPTALRKAVKVELTGFPPADKTK